MEIFKSLNRPSDCVFYCSWQTDYSKSNSMTEYQSCKDCGCRKIIHRHNGHQPVDRAWLDNRPVFIR